MFLAKCISREQLSRIMAVTDPIPSRAELAARAAASTRDLSALFASRIVVLDGAMGSLIQTFGLQERISAANASSPTRTI